MVWRGAQDDGSSEDDKTPGPTITRYQQHIPCQDSVPYHREVWLLAKNSPHPTRPSPKPIKRIKNPSPPGPRRHHLGTAPPNKKSSPQPTTIKTFTTHRHRHRCRRHHNRRPRRQQLLLHGQSRINGRTLLRGPRQPHRHPVHPASKPIVHRDHGHTRHPIHRR